MAIILYELRKIFEWKRVLVTLIFCLVFAFLNLEFHFRVFPNGQPLTDVLNIAVELIEQYGTELSKDNLMDLEKRRENTIAEFDNYIQGRVDFQEQGITDFQQISDLEFESEKWRLADKMIFQERNELFWEIEALYWFSIGYEHAQGYVEVMESFISTLYSQREIDRFREVLAREKQTNFPGFIMDNYRTIITHTTTMISLSIAIMLSSIYLKDFNNRLINLQYSSQIGRKLFLKKLTAAILAAVAITTVQLSIILGLYLLINQTTPFFAADINSVWGNLAHYNMTFGQYILMTIGLCYLIGIMVACLCTFGARLFTKYLTLIGAQIVFFAFLIGILFNYLIRNPIQAFIPQHIPPLIYGGLMIATIILLTYQWQKEKKRN